MRSRILLAGSIVVIAIGALYAVGIFSSQRGPAGAAVSGANFTNADCRECHAAAWREWEESYHAQAWDSTDVQAAFQHFGYDRKCQSCHAPVPLLVAGQQTEPQLRDDDLESGVNCLTCHAMADGSGVAATKTIDAPCRPRAVEWLSSSAMCGTCHDAIFDDWSASPYARADSPAHRTCHDCHMRRDDDGGAAARVTHLCLGGHDEVTVRGCVSMTCRQEEAELVVEVTNHGAGHNFPGERHNRQLTLQVVQRNGQHEITSARQELIKGITPFRGESTSEKIKAGETVRYRFAVVDPPVAAQVRLLYKLFPWYADKDALVVCESQVELTAESNER